MRELLRYIVPVITSGVGAFIGSLVAIKWKHTIYVINRREEIYKTLAKIINKSFEFKIPKESLAIHHTQVDKISEELKTLGHINPESMSEITNEIAIIRREIEQETEVMNSYNNLKNILSSLLDDMAELIEDGSFTLFSSHKIAKLFSSFVCSLKYFKDFENLEEYKVPFENFENVRRQLICQLRKESGIKD